MSGEPPPPPASRVTQCAPHWTPVQLAFHLARKTHMWLFKWVWHHCSPTDSKSSGGRVVATGSPDWRQQNWGFYMSWGGVGLFAAWSQRKVLSCISISDGGYIGVRDIPSRRNIANWHDYVSILACTFSDFVEADVQHCSSSTPSSHVILVLILHVCSLWRLFLASDCFVKHGAFQESFFFFFRLQGVNLWRHARPGIGTASFSVVSSVTV